MEVTGLKGDTADGLMVARTDTYGAYYWNGSAWVQCATIASMPAADVGFNNTTGDPIPDQTNIGVYEITIAPSNHSTFYMVLNGYVYKTTNSCATWTRTNLAQQSNVAANTTSYKLLGSKLAVDPADANIVYFGAPAALYRTSDGGANWSTIASVPASTDTHGIIVTVDQTSTSGGSRVVYASSYGNGVYRSTNGGTTFSLTSSGPTTHNHAIVDQNGVYWQTANSGAQRLWKYASGSWSNINSGQYGNLALAVVVDPANANNIWIGLDSGNIVTSTNGGAAWTDPNFNNTQVTGANDIPWLANAGDTYMSLGNMVYNKANSRVYQSAGIGVWYSASPGATMQWTSQSVGIEQLVGNQVIVPPGNRPVVASWDRPTFYSANSSVYPSSYGPNTLVQINAGWAVDWSPQTNSTMVGLFNWFGPIDYSGKSTNSGQTWSAFATTPSLTTGGGSYIGGTILAASDSHYIIIQNNGNSAGVYYTANSGSTWTEATVGSVPSVASGSDTGWGGGYSRNRHVGDCDKTTTDTCYIYNPGSGGALPNFSGVYKTTNGGSSWSNVKSGVLTTYGDGVFNAVLRCVPGKSGHLFYTGGGQTGAGAIGSTQDLKRSSDGGVTWTSVPNVKNVYAIGFGKDNGGAYPAIYIAGFVTFNGGSTYAWGIYRSLNGDQATPTWTLLGNYPNNSFDTVTWLEGDPSNYGYVYTAFRGSGWAYGYFP